MARWAFPNPIAVAPLCPESMCITTRKQLRASTSGAELANAKQHFDSSKRYDMLRHYYDLLVLAFLPPNIEKAFVEEGIKAATTKAAEIESAAAHIQAPPVVEVKPAAHIEKAARTKDVENKSLAHHVKELQGALQLDVPCPYCHNKKNAWGHAESAGHVARVQMAAMLNSMMGVVPIS